MAATSPSALLALSERPVAERPDTKGADPGDGRFAGLMAQFIQAPAAPPREDAAPRPPARADPPPPRAAASAASASLRAEPSGPEAPAPARPQPGPDAQASPSPAPEASPRPIPRDASPGAPLSPSPGWAVPAGIPAPATPAPTSPAPPEAAAPAVAPQPTSRVEVTFTPASAPMPPNPPGPPRPEATPAQGTPASASVPVPAPVRASLESNAEVAGPSRSLAAGTLQPSPQGLPAPLPSAPQAVLAEPLPPQALPPPSEPPVASSPEEATLSAEAAPVRITLLDAPTAQVERRPPGAITAQALVEKNQAAPNPEASASRQAPTPEAAPDLALAGRLQPPSRPPSQPPSLPQPLPQPQLLPRVQIPGDQAIPQDTPPSPRLEAPSPTPTRNPAATPNPIATPSPEPQPERPVGMAEGGTEVRLAEDPLPHVKGPKGPSIPAPSSPGPEPAKAEALPPSPKRLLTPLSPAPIREPEPQPAKPLSPSASPAATPGLPSPQGEAREVVRPELGPSLTETPALKGGPQLQIPPSHGAEGSPLAALGTLPKVAAGPQALPAQPLAPAPPPSAPVAQVEGGLRWMLKGGAQEARLQLHPESLGQVTIHLRVEGGEVHARLWITEPASIQAVQEGRPHLEASLKEQGLQLGGFDLQQGHRPFQEAPAAPAFRERSVPELLPARQEAPALPPPSILNPHHVELYV